MKAATIIGVVLIVLGVIALGYQGVMWVTGTEQVAKIGGVEIYRQKDFAIPLAPIIAGACVAGGVILLAVGARKSSP
jgi:hypothetical protein